MNIKGMWIEMDLDLIIVALLFVALAVLCGLLMTVIYKRLLGGGKGTRSPITIVLLLVGVGVLLVLVVGVYEYTESSPFCGQTCHVMEPYYASYTNPGNNSFMRAHAEQEVACADCHNNPGVEGKIEALGSAVQEGLIYVFQTYDEDHLGHGFSDDKCLKCHDDVTAAKPTLVLGVRNQTVAVHSTDLACEDCHVSHIEGSGISTETCSFCHVVPGEDMGVALANHGERFTEDCFDCHDTPFETHREASFIHFSASPTFSQNDFCGDCHGTTTEAVTASSLFDQVERNCTDCHDAHEEGTGPHLALTTDPFDNCQLCHVQYTPSITIHDFTQIDYKDLTIEIPNQFCADCHQPIVTVIAENSAVDPENRNCTTCHPSHSADGPEAVLPHIVSGELGNCQYCHVQYTPEITIHNFTGIDYDGYPSVIPNQFCADCHETVADSFDYKFHSIIHCEDCHAQHSSTLTIDWNVCGDCHVSIPSSHRARDADCIDCHNLDAIHGTDS